MRFNYDEIDLINKDIEHQKQEYYRVYAIGYIIEIYRTGQTIDEFKAIARMFRYYCKIDDVSYLLGYSQTDSNNANVIYERTGQRGRPKKIITGKTIEPHLHPLIIGNPNKSAWSTACNISKYLNKLYGGTVTKIVAKGDNYHLYNTIGYIYRQSDIVRTFGEFDFRGYYNSR